MSDRSFAEIRFGPLEEAETTALTRYWLEGVAPEAVLGSVAFAVSELVEMAPDEVDVSDGFVVAQVREAVGGEYEINESGLPEVLRDHEVGYDLWCDGCAGSYDGTMEMWRPGLPKPWTAAKLDMGDAAVGRGQYLRLRAGHSEASAALAELDRLFGSGIAELGGAA